MLASASALFRQIAGKSVKPERVPAEDHVFNHARAQRYELDFAIGWMKENAEAHREWIEPNFRGQWTAHPNLIRDFFDGSQDRFVSFVEAARGKTIIDIGTGPLPILTFFPWAARRIMIDPLASEYKRICDGVDPRWLSGVDPRSAKAEAFMPDLEKMVDGAIICRNCLDHVEEPFLVLSNISSYAASGCFLLFWSDLYHLDGHDEGHTNITRDVEGIKRLVVNLGFDLIHELPNLRSGTDHHTINWGTLARKR